MEVHHRISFNAKDNVESILDSLNIEYVKTVLPKGYTIHIDITESDPRWPQINALHGFDWYNAVFTKEEILKAEWVRLMPLNENGYPQPKDYKRFKQYTYDIKCPRCGAGNRQISPLHLAKEPNLEKYDFMSLIWTYALLCSQKVLEALKEAEIQGFEVLPAIIHSTGEHSKIVSQLKVPAVALPALAEEDKINPENCHTCGTAKYSYLKKGYMHLKSEALSKNVDCQLTYEWFGGARFQEYLISHRLAQLIIDNNWKGVSLKPTILI
jgi:hypothetical protein